MINQALANTWILSTWFILFFFFLLFQLEFKAVFTAVAHSLIKIMFWLVCLESCKIISSNYNTKFYISLFFSFYFAYYLAAHCIRGTSLVKSRFTPTSIRFGEHDLLSEIDCEEVNVIALISSKINWFTYF